MNAYALDRHTSSAYHFNMLKVIGEVGNDLIIALFRLKAFQEHLCFPIVNYRQMENGCDTENFGLYSFIAVLILMYRTSFYGYGNW